MITEQTTSQINLVGYLQIFLRRKWFFIIPLAAGLCVGFLVANALPKIYESYTVMLVQEEKYDNPIISGLAISTTAAQRLSNLREQILGWNRLVKLAEKLNLTKDIKNQQQFENLILGDLRKNIVVNMRGPSLVRIAFQGKNPDMAQLTVKTITDIFIEENVTAQNQESDIAVTFLEEQLKVYQNKIKESEIANLEDQLKSLLVDSTEDHPLVRDLKAKIANVKEDYLKTQGILLENPDFVKNPAYEKMKSDLEKELVTIKGSPASPDLYKAAAISNITSVLAQDIDVNRTIYNMLLQRLETAKISKRLDASKQGTRYIVLDPPRIPFAPIKPNKFLVTLLGAFLGGALGAGIIVLLEFVDTSILGMDEAKLVLDLPVLGAISRIMTNQDMAREKVKNTMRIGISISIGVIFIALVIIYSVITKP
ncbi:MAG: Wzz/FepE/Etk N-terminal domain-containing protein [Candidatus Omnitrophica bacterium]|nr:Wzz/FepE/Etk N-terminal domain-containing protein [Candidatus Omnitrophota bacterium]